MSHLLSDEDSTDSDSGIRFKTETTRKPQNDVPFRTNQRLTNRKNVEDRSYDSYKSSYSSHSKPRDRSTDRKYSRDRHRRSRSKEHYRKRSKSREKIRFNRSRSRSKEDRHKRSQSSEKERHKRSRSKEKITTNRYNSDKFRDKTDDKKHSIKNNHKTKRDDNDCLKNIEHTTVNIIKTCNSSENSNSDSEISKSEPSVSEIKVNQKTDTYGPVLPSKINKSNTKPDSDDQNYGPKLPPSNGNNTYGPIAPSELNKSTTDNIVLKEPTLIPKTKSEKQEIELYGPALPSSSNKISESENIKNKYGPSLPTHLIKNVDKQVTDIDSDTFGPSLPPNLQKTAENKNKIMGPSLPPHLLEKFKNQQAEETNIEHVKVESDNSDDDMIGPLPEGHSSTNNSHKLLEERALELRINALNPVDTAPKREEWMTALPDVHRVNLGLGPRQFRSKEGPDLSDRSSWTDTPEEKEKKTKKEKKIDIKEKSKLEHIARRDKEQEEIVKKHKKKKKRDKALIELHQEKLAKKKKVTMMTFIFKNTNSI